VTVTPSRQAGRACSRFGIWIWQRGRGRLIKSMRTVFPPSAEIPSPPTHPRPNCRPSKTTGLRSRRFAHTGTRTHTPHFLHRLTLPFSPPGAAFFGVLRHFIDPADPPCTQSDPTCTPDRSHSCSQGAICSLSPTHTSPNFLPHRRLICICSHDRDGHRYQYSRRDVGRPQQEVCCAAGQTCVPGLVSDSGACFSCAIRTGLTGRQPGI
jgi:hypothetical protein